MSRGNGAFLEKVRIMPRNHLLQAHLLRILRYREILAGRSSLHDNLGKSWVAKSLTFKF